MERGWQSGNNKKIVQVDGEDIKRDVVRQGQKFQRKQQKGFANAEMNVGRPKKKHSSLLLRHVSNIRHVGNRNLCKIFTLKHYYMAKKIFWRIKKKK